MSVLPAILVGIFLVGQDAVPPAQAVETRPAAEVAAGPVQGVVRVECEVAPGGRLRNCVIISETPVGYGFGEAALRGAGESRVRLDADNAPRPGEKMQFNMRFREERPRRP